MFSPLTERFKKSPRPAAPLSAQEWLSSSFARPVRMLEVGSIHLRLRTPEERKRIERAEVELYNGLRFSIQRIALPTPLDLTDYLSELTERVATDPQRDRAEQLWDKVQHVGQLISTEHLVQWRNLVLIPDEGEGVAERVLYIRSGLERMRLEVRELDAAAQAQVWYDLLNPHSGNPDHFRLGENPAGYLDRITPRDGLVTAPGRSFRLGNRYCRILIVQHYPRHVTQSQLSDIYRLDRRVVVIEHIHPMASADLQRDISHSIAEMQARLNTGLSSYERERTRAQLRDAQRLIRQLAAENHNLLDFCLYLMVCGETPAEVEEVSKRMTDRLRGKGIVLHPTHLWQHDDALRCCLPAAQNLLREQSRRNIPAASMPATFPYAYAELTHGTGFVMGTNKMTGNLVIIDPWRLVNPHSIFIGMSGTGKSFLLGLMLIAFWSQGIQIRQLDIEGDKGRLCAKLHGQRVRIAPHAGAYINPMEVRRPPLDPSVYLAADAEEPANGLAATIQRQKVLFRLLLPDISRVEMAKAEALLLECYHARGITYDNYADFIGRPLTWPTWTELLPLLQGSAETQNLWAVLHSWVHGALGGMLDQPTNVNLDNQYVLLDIHDCMSDPEARSVIFFLGLTFLWDEVNRDWHERKILDIDELGILGDSEDALQFVWKVSKSARRRRCRLQMATQDPADVLSGRNPATLKYALGIVSNCATKVLGYLEPTALQQVAQIVKLSEAEVALISGMYGKPAEKLLICGEQRAHIEVPVSLRELEILDPEGYAKRTGQEPQ